MPANEKLIDTNIRWAGRALVGARDARISRSATEVKLLEGVH